MSGYLTSLVRSRLSTVSLRSAISLSQAKNFSLSVCNKAPIIRSCQLSGKCKTINRLPSVSPSSSLLLGKLSVKDILFQQKRCLPTLNQIRRLKPRTKKKRPKIKIPNERRILFGPQRKGVCVKNVVRTPRKPNSAQRKCAVLRLNNGKLITAYIPGQRPNLQEHGVVLFRGGRVQDCPGLKYKIIRGVYDMN